MSKYAKFIVAVAGAILTTAQTVLPLSANWHAWLTVLLAGVTAASVYAVQNAPADATARHQVGE